jgi:hypothetical protein
LGDFIGAEQRLFESLATGKLGNGWGKRLAARLAHESNCAVVVRVRLGLLLALRSLALRRRGEHALIREPSLLCAPCPLPTPAVAADERAAHLMYIVKVGFGLAVR